MTTPPFITGSKLSAIKSIQHGFFSRHGGVSTHFYTSLNVGLGSGDDHDKVIENRNRCETALGAAADSLITLHQVHSAKATIIDEHNRSAWEDYLKSGSQNTGQSLSPSLPDLESDGVVTKLSGVMLGILTADCMPFLFADEKAGVIGAAHGGWRGALNGVLETTIDAMVALGANPANINAALGPCLRQDNFEIGLDLLDEFTKMHPLSTRFFKPGISDQKRQFDLAGFAFWRLKSKGLVHIDDVGICTLANPDDYFSYRHSRQNNQGDYGRNLSAIMINHPS